MGTTGTSTSHGEINWYVTRIYSDLQVHTVATARDGVEGDARCLAMTVCAVPDRAWESDTTVASLDNSRLG